MKQRFSYLSSQVFINTQENQENEPKGYYRGFFRQSCLVTAVRFVLLFSLSLPENYAFIRYLSFLHFH